MKLASLYDGTTLTWGLIEAFEQQPDAAVRLATPALRTQFPDLRSLLAAGAPEDALPALSAAPLRRGEEACPATRVRQMIAL